MHKKISIITINFNNLLGLVKTYESFYSQVHKHIQFIIIDGGSSDGSKEFIIKHQSHINFWVSEPDKGVYHAMNKGLEQATGDYCIFLNSGDYFVNRNVLRLVSEKIDISSDLVYGLIQWEETLSYWNPRIGLKPFEMAFKSLIPHQGVFFKTGLIKKLGGYHESYKVISDWALLLEIHKLSKNIQKIDLVVSICEKQGISATYEALAKRERLNYLWKNDKKNLLLGFLFLLKKRFSPNS